MHTSGADSVKYPVRAFASSAGGFSALETGDVQPFNLANHASTRTGSTALHAAASRGYLDIVQWLVEHCGAMPDLEDKEGECLIYFRRRPTFTHATQTAGPLCTTHVLRATLTSYGGYVRTAARHQKLMVRGELTHEVKVAGRH
ncbi:hypothetical protein BDN71DRAFT_382874 [Pleurotus eryngii]|uniref:Uncharacterized protein n=1 Tax=Pleurotus eryngii TaxID=5323 RepID=A0A9P6A1K9_PLEER|nr:hypothetical protein BDN71DRAFT_382874 [Pleurotus eryngii]